MSSLSSWGGLGELGERGLCEVWWGGDNARGSRPHEGGFAIRVRVRVTQLYPPTRAVEL
jgi:hypothetical protein